MTYNNSIYRDYLVHQHGYGITPEVDPNLRQSSVKKESDSEYKGYPDLSTGSEIKTNVVPVRPEIAPPKPLLTQKIHNQTLQLLSKAFEVSGTILFSDIQRPSPYAPQVMQTSPIARRERPSINVHVVDQSVKLFNRETHVHHHYQEESKTQQKDVIRIVVGVFSLLGGLFLAYKMGQAVAEGENVQEQETTFKELKDQWNVNQKYYEDSYQSLVKRVINRIDNITQRRETNRTHKIALFVFGLIACGAGFSGSLIGSAPLMAGAVGMGAIVGSAALYKLGYALFSTRDRQDAKVIDEALRELNQLQPM